MPVIKHIYARDAVYIAIGIPPSLRDLNDDDLVSPSEIKEGDSFTLFGTEARELEDILYAIGRHESIEKYLNAVEPEYLNLFLNHPMQHDGQFGNRFFTPAHLAANLGNITALKEYQLKELNLT